MEIEIKNLTKRFGDIEAVKGVSATISDGEFVTLVGPSGCGKTTTLRMISGLESVTDGSIKFGGKDVTGTPARELNIAFVFQDNALYPHMTVRRNMSFALEDQGFDDDVIDSKIQDAAELLGIKNQLDQKPNELSGGQQQRVALGRSIVRDPDVFLLDEPLSDLDAKLRAQMRTELQKLHSKLETTTVYVTHDQEEALTMSDRIIVMNNGEFQQIGEPGEVYYKPTNRFVARFIGNPSMNFFDTLGDDRKAIGAQFLDEIEVSQSDSSIAEIGIRPEDLNVTSEGILSGEVRVFEQLGSFNLVYISVEGRDEDIVVQIPAQEHYQTGEQIDLKIRNNRVHLFGSDGKAIYSPPRPGTDETSDVPGSSSTSEV